MISRLFRRPSPVIERYIGYRVFINTEVEELKSIFEAVDSSQRTNAYIKNDGDVEKLLDVLSDVCQDKILVVNNGGMKNGKQGTKSGRNSNSGRNKKAVSC